jgi:ABC-type bacteriocin/lantibiotic exporter with double-glycine peptidase domain
MKWKRPQKIHWRNKKLRWKMQLFEQGKESSLSFGTVPDLPTSQEIVNSKCTCRHVTFIYPGSQVSKEALSDISLKIKSGQFVVLVGANGSGKSTLLKMLCRLYQPSAPSLGSDDEKNPTTGQVLIDSLPAPSYTESSLRRSMAVLSQDNLIYPGFSLGDNIGMGHIPFLTDDEAIRVATAKAGATGVLERMKNGMNTILDPMPEYYQFNISIQEKDHPLKKVLEDLQRPTEVSGGEKQRIVA